MHLHPHSGCTAPSIGYSLAIPVPSSKLAQLIVVSEMVASGTKARAVQGADVLHLEDVHSPSQQ